jgi:hypothetical protein
MNQVTIDPSEHPAPPPSHVEGFIRPELRGFEIAKRTKDGQLVRVYTLKPTMLALITAKADVTWFNRRAHEQKTGEMYMVRELQSVMWIPPAVSEPLVLEADEPEQTELPSHDVDAAACAVVSGAISEGGLPDGND